MDMTQGIYKITNLVNGKFYIGSSVDMKKRWKSHKYELRKNSHHNKHLQYAWNKYEEENFKFEVIAYIKDDDMLLIVEQLYIESTKCYLNEIGYNMEINTNPNLNFVFSKETLDNIYEMKTNKNNLMTFGSQSSSAREKISKSSRNTNNRINNINITDDDVKDIYLLLHNGINVWEIQKLYNLGDKIVNNIKWNKTWKEVTSKINLETPLPFKLVEIINNIIDSRVSSKAHRLTADQVNTIKSLLDVEEMTQKEIAIHVGVTLHQVKGISRNRNTYNKNNFS